MEPDEGNSVDSSALSLVENTGLQEVSLVSSQVNLEDAEKLVLGVAEFGYSWNKIKQYAFPDDIEDYTLDDRWKELLNTANISRESRRGIEKLYPQELLNRAMAVESMIKRKAILNEVEHSISSIDYDDDDDLPMEMEKIIRDYPVTLQEVMELMMITAAMNPAKNRAVALAIGSMSWSYPSIEEILTKTSWFELDGRLLMLLGKLLRSGMISEERVFDIIVVWVTKFHTEEDDDAKREGVLSLCGFYNTVRRHLEGMQIGNVLKMAVKNVLKLEDGTWVPEMKIPISTDEDSIQTPDNTPLETVVANSVPEESPAQGSTKPLVVNPLNIVVPKPASEGKTHNKKRKRKEDREETHSVKLQLMPTLAEMLTDNELAEIKSNVAHECSNYASVNQVEVGGNQPRAVVLVQFTNPTDADKCALLMNGRVIGGRLVVARKDDSA